MRRWCTSDRHDWVSWDQYQSIHESYLSNHLDYFIIEDRLTVTPTPQVVAWSGVLLCVDGFEIHVTKSQDVRYQGGQPQVRTSYYAYHVLRRVGEVVVNLFRYDNAHPHLGHPDPHHCHRFDDEGHKIEPPVHIGAAQWPTLGEVVSETFDLWLWMTRE